MKKILILLICLTLIPIVQVNAEEAIWNPITEDYRPRYNFTYDVFKYLPPFPQDFWIRKQLFETQEVQADRLTPEYYLQPEILPGWNDWCDRIYGIEEKKDTRTYGISIYPSRFHIFNMKPNDTETVSALIYTNFGVEIYQGGKIVTKYDHDAVDVELVCPNDMILLAPTYPEFNSEWCRLIIFNITLLDYGNHTIEIWEEKPDSDIDESWKDIYGDDYTSGGSILGLEIPKAKIHIYSPPPKTSPIENSPEDGFFNANPWFFVLLLGFAVLLVFWCYYVIRKRREKRAKSKET